MPAALPTPDVPDVPDVPVTSVAGAIARMEAIGAALPAGDGLACFNRMYLDVTSQVNSQLGQGFYADPAFMTQLDVTFANLYFAAADMAGNPAAVPLAWRPLAERRTAAGIEPQGARAFHVWTLIHEIPEGNWAGGGRVIGGRPIDRQRTAQAAGSLNRKANWRTHSGRPLDDRGTINRDGAQHLTVSASLEDTQNLTWRQCSVIDR